MEVLCGGPMAGIGDWCTGAEKRALLSSIIHRGIICAKLFNTIAAEVIDETGVFLTRNHVPNGELVPAQMALGGKRAAIGPSATTSNHQMIAVIEKKGQ